MTKVIEKPKVVKKQIFKVLPYIDSNIENLGLTKYKMVIHDGASYLEQLTCLETENGVRRYLTGLNENAPEILAIQDKDEKTAAIKSIREKVIFLEKSFGSNYLKIDDEDFWKNVKTVHPTNYAFWDKISIKPSNEPLFLDPENPNDLIRICGIQAGGFSTVAKSFEDARTMASPPKFYLDSANDTAITKNESIRIKYEAGALLNELFSEQPKKLMYVVKNIDKNSYEYKKSTSAEVIYSFLENFIEGKGSEKSAKAAAKKFITVCGLSNEDVRLRAVIADAAFYKIIQTKSDGLMYHTKTDTMIGRNVEELLKKLKDPLHSDISNAIQEEVEAYWEE